MAVKRSISRGRFKEDPAGAKSGAAAQEAVALAEEEAGLDPQEEKMLDWILKGVTAFILGWLGLSILMVIGGYFGIWK